MILANRTKLTATKCGIPNITLPHKVMKSYRVSKSTLTVYINTPHPPTVLLVSSGPQK